MRQSSSCVPVAQFIYCMLSHKFPHIAFMNRTFISNIEIVKHYHIRNIIFTTRFIKTSDAYEFEKLEFILQCLIVCMPNIPDFIHSAWIGLYTFGAPQVMSGYRWSAGDGRVGYTAFNPGEPNGYSRERCVHMWLRMLYKWNNTPCDGTHPYVCECPIWLILAYPIGW